MSNSSGRNTPNIVGITYADTEQRLYGVDAGGVMWEYMFRERIWARL